MLAAWRRGRAGSRSAQERRPGRARALTAARCAAPEGSGRSCGHPECAPPRKRAGGGLCEPAAASVPPPRPPSRPAGTARWVWPLHNVWHVTSCIAAYYMLFHMYYYRVERLGLEGAYGARRSFPSLPKPLTFNAAWHRELEERALARLAKDLGGAQSGAAK
jgi:hypothetical protein